MTDLKIRCQDVIIKKRDIDGLVEITLECIEGDDLNNLDVAMFISPDVYMTDLGESEITFNLSDYSMISALEHRGYTVSKNGSDNG